MCTVSPQSCPCAGLWSHLRGWMLGPNQPVILHLLDIPFAAEALEGVRMELVDAAYPLVKGAFLLSDDPIPLTAVCSLALRTGAPLVWAFRGPRLTDSYVCWVV